MIRGEELKNKLNLPDISQVGVVVRDLDRAIDYYEKFLGLGPFVRPEITYTEKFYHGKLVNSTWKMGFASLGPVELELDQPVAGPSIFKDFLGTKGEGLHHFGFDIKDLDNKLEICRRLGIKILQSGRTPYGGFALLDTRKIGGVIFELIQRKCRRI